jgi:hypothetical protein
VIAGCIALIVAATAGAGLSVHNASTTQLHAVAPSYRLAAKSSMIGQPDPVTAQRLAVGAWSVFPSLVTASADWIECKSAELAGHTVLLGATMLPETALGLGIAAGHAQRTRWPENIWPLVYRTATDSLVLPHLNLGTAAFRDRDGG